MHRMATYALFALNLVVQIGFSQPSNTPLRSIYLLGNTADLTADDPILNGLNNLTAIEDSPFTVLYLGDFFGANDSRANQPIAEQKNLNRLVEVATKNPKGSAFFIPGDVEWNHAGKNGWQQVRQLEAFLANTGNERVTFLPSDGCPGPTVTDLGDDLRIIAINSQWFAHPFDKPEESDVRCDMYNIGEFWDELEDLIEQAPHRNIIIAAHHPVLSYGQYAGYKSLKQHIFPLTDKHRKWYLPLPVLGSFYASFRKNIGTDTDLANEPMQAFAKRMKQTLQKHKNVVYAAGHELDVQALQLDGNFHINSGAAAVGKAVAMGEETLFRSRERGFVRLQYLADGSVFLQFFQYKNGETNLAHEQALLSGQCSVSQKTAPPNGRYLPYQPQAEPLSKMPKGRQGKATVTPSNKYEVGSYRRKVFGEHYRSTWATPVTVPILDLDTLYGGLTPTSTGGGGQSKVLKLTAANGQSYNFRSVDKYPAQSTRTKAELLDGWYGAILQDMVSGQYPYSSLVADKLMEAAGIRHAPAQLFIMPDHPKLGEYRSEFAGMLGVLELRPKGKNKGGEGFEGADKVVKTVRLFKHLIEDHDHRVDAPSYAKARLFDLLVADWDRTPDNWRFMGYGDKKALTFFAMPKDRDRAFHKWEGIYRLADQEFGSPDIAHFGQNFGDFKSLTHKGRNIDRMLLNEMTWPQWEQVATELKAEITDDAIKAAMASVPASARMEAEKLIGETLIARRDKLMEAAFKFYRLLAKKVDVVGSNKRELFEVQRHEDGNVEVRVFKLKKTGEKDGLRYQRLLLRSETKEVRLHGLGGADEFRLSGEVAKSIPVRIIPGDGSDLVVDSSRVKGPSDMTKIYGKSSEDTLHLNREDKAVKSPEELRFTYNLYEPDSYLPMPSFIFNKEDSIGIGLGVKIVRQGFNKPGYAKKYYFRAAGTTRHSFWLNASADFQHVMGKWDLELDGKATNADRSVRHFFGIGNETPKDSVLYSAGFYENRTNSLLLKAGLRREFWRRSHFSASTVLERYVVTNDTSSVQLTDIVYGSAAPLRGMGTNNYFGSLLDLDLDLTDAKNLPSQGVRLQFSHRYFLNLTEKGSRFGRFSADLRFYETIRLKKPLTIGLRGGYAQSYGEAPFYYLATVGQRDNLRGYMRNRFVGERAAYTNLDLRLHLGTVKTSVIPFGIGLTGFADMGRVWANGQNSGTWHRSCGGGFYLSPINENFNLSFLFAASKEERLMFDLSFGISL